MVADRTSIKFFDASGAFDRSVGRPGKGPGEFTQLRKVCVIRGDTLVAISYSDRRFSVWSPRGDLVRAGILTGATAVEPCFADGTLLTTRAPAPGAGPSRRGLSRYVRVRLGGELVADIGQLPIEEYTSPIWRTVSVVVHDNTILAADARDFELRIYTLTGRLRRILRVLEQPEAVPDSVWRTRLRLAPTAIRVVAESLSGPRRYPAFGEVRLDSMSRVWVHDYHHRGRWFVFERDGSFLGRVDLPTFHGQPSRLVFLGRDEVGLRHSDAAGAAVLSFHRLVRVN